MLRTSLRTLAGIGLLGLAVPLTPAMAATATATIGITATVQATCLISANPLAFGNYTGSQVSTATALSVTCTNTTPYNVGLDAGEGPNNSVTGRQMTGPAGQHLSYSLTTDAGHAANWGNTVGSDTVSGTGNGSAQPYLVNAVVPGNQYVSPGAYSDTVTATVTYYLVTDKRRQGAACGLLADCAGRASWAEQKVPVSRAVLRPPEHARTACDAASGSQPNTTHETIFL